MQICALMHREGLKGKCWAKVVTVSIEAKTQSMPRTDNNHIKQHHTNNIEK